MHKFFLYRFHWQMPRPWPLTQSASPRPWPLTQSTSPRPRLQSFTSLIIIFTASLNPILLHYWDPQYCLMKSFDLRSSCRWHPTATASSLLVLGSLLICILGTMRSLRWSHVFSILEGKFCISISIYIYISQRSSQNPHHNYSLY